MESAFFVELGDIIDTYGLEIIYLPEGGRNIKITHTDLIRPGLPLVGFFDYFDNHRIQIIGRVETSFLSDFTPEQRNQSLDRLFATKVPAVIVARGLEIFPEMLEAAKKHNVPLLRTQEATSAFMAALISYLNVQLAPRVIRHGVLVEVYGEGVLLLGESGVGKSETAIELVKRGHRLVADDAVEIKRVSDKTLVGSAPKIIRHFIELRGIGVADVRRLFGMGAIKETEKIDLVIQLEVWDESKFYDRLGIDNQYIDILGLKIPSLTIPVKPGRNLAIIIEVAAMNNRQKKMGYNAAKELNERIMSQYRTDENTK